MTTDSSQTPSVAIVYDYVTTGFGGAEVVLEQLHQIYPHAPLFTTVVDSSVATWILGWPVITSFLQRLPAFLRRRHQWQALFAPLAIESLNVSDFDIVISVSAGSAKGILTKPDQLHIDYMLTPTRYLYSDTLKYFHPILQLPIVSWISHRCFSYLRWWDRAAAQRSDNHIAISKLVAKRAKLNYNISIDTVIYPPFRNRATVIANTDYSSWLPTSFNVIISRLVWYKQVDLAIRAAQKTRTTLMIVGDGAHRKQLIKVAGRSGLVKNNQESFLEFLSRAGQTSASILFCGLLTDGESTYLLQKCQSVLMLGEEDFGMTALEALSQGKPVIISQNSGVAELLTNEQHGLLLEKVTIKTVANALQKIKKMSFSTALLKETALRYSDSVFRHTFAAIVNQLWQQQKERYGKYA
jgi:glycosyltransferase involved in cell wall biosynthesis